MNPIPDGCRLCLDSSVGIFTTIDSPALKDQMAKVFCFSIEPKQGYCSGVCQSCSDTISEFYQYSEKVRQNQEVLNGNVTNCDQTYDSKISLKCVKQEPINNFGLPETIEDAHKPDSEFSDAEEAPILDSKIKQENYMLQTPSDSEMMEPNQDTYGPIDEVPKVEEEVHALHSEIRVEHFKIEIPDSDLPDTINEENKIPILDPKIPFEKRKEDDEHFKKHIKMVCDVCGIIAASYTALRRHFNKVHKLREGYVVCCNKKLRSRCQIREHINFHANPDMFRCEVCARTFKSQDALNIHTLKNHPQNRKCDHCPRSFADESALVEHMKLHKKCPKCNKLCTNKSFRNHMIMVHGEKELDAHEPDSNVSETEEVLILDSKISQENYKVQTANESEHSITTDKPQTREEEDQLFKNHISLACDLCGTLAESYPALDSHFKEEHKRRNSYVVCCNRKLISRCHIREHINFHANPDLFRCKVCGFRFKRREYLNVHMLKRHPQTHKCNHCSQIFAEESAITEHMKLHNMKVQCPKCNKFCTKRYLRLHMIRIHGDAKRKKSCEER